MNRTIEVELKYEILDPAEITGFTSTLRKLNEKRIVDMYLDTAAGNLFKRGIFIRIRNDATFDIKFNQEDVNKNLDEAIEHTHCDEVSRPLPFRAEDKAVINETLELLGLKLMEVPSLDDLIQRNAFIKSMVIDKHRQSFEADSFHIDIDEVEGLGSFLEIEAMTNETGDRDTIIREMKERLAGLQLRYIDTGYNELYWRKHDFNLYLQGKYLLTEDREKYRPQSVRSS